MEGTACQPDGSFKKSSTIMLFPKEEGQWADIPIDVGGRKRPLDATLKNR